MRLIFFLLLLLVLILNAEAAPSAKKAPPPPSKWTLADSRFIGERWHPATLRDCDVIKPGAVLVANYSVGIDWPWRSFCYWGKQNERY